MPTPDESAELLQIEERGPDLVKRCLDDPQIRKAVQMVAAGFSPSDVAQALELPWSAELHEEYVEEQLEGKIKVWECKTHRCKQRDRVATADDPPDCPSCGVEMKFLMAVDSPSEIGHMQRINVHTAIPDPLSRTDRTRENIPVGDWDDGDE